MMSSLQILLISGSTRQPSHTRALTGKIETALAQQDVKTNHWNLRERPLPIADPEFHHDPLQHTDPIVRNFAEYAHNSDAFVLSSPIYHNSYSGVLKNALDHLAIAQFYYKPVGLVSHGGQRSTQAVDQLRIVVRGLLGNAIPTQVCTSGSDYTEVNSQYDLTSGEILLRIERFVTELILFAHQLRMLRASVLNN
jgi:NAD(P)H-dependent FMN reductase